MGTITGINASQHHFLSLKYEFWLFQLANILKSFGNTRPIGDSLILLRNAGGVYKELEVVVTSAIGCQIPDSETGLRCEHGMRVVRVTKAGIEHSYHPLASFPTRVDL